MADIEQLREKLDRARDHLASARKAMERADGKTENAREMGGGIPGFGGSGNQRAAHQVRSAWESAQKAWQEARDRIEHWEYKVKSLERRIAEIERRRYTAADLKGATYVKDSTSWRKVVRVNAKTVTVESGYSWHDRIDIDQIREAYFLDLPSRVSGEEKPQ